MVGDNVVNFENSAGDSRRRSVAGGGQIVARCRQLIAETLPRLSQEMFERLDDDLYELADKSESDLVQTRYFEAMRELRKLRQPIEAQFQKSVLQAFDDFWAGRQISGIALTADDSNDELSLIADEELEEKLAMSGVVSKAESRFRRELFALNMRFAHLVDRGEVQNGENPLGPSILVSRFGEALSLWEGDVPVKLVIYKMFDRYVMSFVGGLYDDVNDVLVEGGILPKIVQRARRNPVAPSVLRARNEDPQASGVPQVEQGGTEFGAESPAQFFNMLGDLLSNWRSATGMSGFGVSNPHLPVVQTNDVLSALHELQQRTIGMAPADLGEAEKVREQFRGNLVQRLDMGSGDNFTKRLDKPDQDVIDIISMLFEFILDDRNLPDAMKALLSRLQIPMLKVAMQDRSFFGSKGHPARRLLNALAQAAVGWVDDGDRSEGSLYGRIESAVVRVLTDFTDDISLFESIYDEFTGFMEREVRGAEVAEERINQVTRGQEQLKLARQRVHDQIKLLLDSATAVPDPVRAILSEAWKDVLLLAFLREGEDSETWKKSVGIAQQLIWSVSPKSDQTERQRLLKLIPELLKSLREGLGNISYDQHKAAQLFKDLQACHIAALRGGQVPPSMREQGADAPAEVEEVILGGEEPIPEPEQIDDEFTGLANDMAVGQWLEWQDRDGGSQRGKLSWRSEVTGTYVFVNRKGAKLAEMTGFSVAALLRGGNAEILDNVDKPLMDRALGAMLDVLKNTGDADGDPSHPSPA